MCHHHILKTLLLRPLDISWKIHRRSWRREEVRLWKLFTFCGSAESSRKRLEMFPVAPVCSCQSCSRREEHWNIPKVLFKLWLVGIYLTYWYFFMASVAFKYICFLGVNCKWLCCLWDLSSPMYSHCEVLGVSSVVWGKELSNERDESDETQWLAQQCSWKLLNGAN